MASPPQVQREEKPAGLGTSQAPPFSPGSQSCPQPRGTCPPAEFAFTMHPKGVRSGRHTHTHTHARARTHTRTHAPKLSLSEEPQSQNQGLEQKHIPKDPTVCKVVTPSGGCDCFLSSRASLTATPAPHLSDFASLGRRKEPISYKDGGAEPSSPAGQEGIEVGN